MTQWGIETNVNQHQSLLCVSLSQRLEVIVCIISEFFKQNFNFPQNIGILLPPATEKTPSFSYPQKGLLLRLVFEVVYSITLLKLFWRQESCVPVRAVWDLKSFWSDCVRESGNGAWLCEHLKVLTHCFHYRMCNLRPNGNIKVSVAVSVNMSALGAVKPYFLCTAEVQFELVVTGGWILPLNPIILTHT